MNHLFLKKLLALALGLGKCFKIAVPGRATVIDCHEYCVYNTSYISSFKTSIDFFFIVAFNIKSFHAF